MGAADVFEARHLPALRPIHLPALRPMTIGGAHVLETLLRAVYSEPELSPVSYIYSVRILLLCVLILLVSSNYYICSFTLLYMCPHNT